MSKVTFLCSCGSGFKVLDYNDLVVLFYMQAAEELGCSIFVHPWDMQTEGRMAKYWLPWLVGEGHAL